MHHTIAWVEYCLVWDFPTLFQLTWEMFNYFLTNFRWKLFVQLPSVMVCFKNIIMYLPHHESLSVCWSDRWSQSARGKLICLQGELDLPCAMYDDHRMGFGRSPKQTASPIFRPQRVRENYFPLHEAPRNDRPYLVGNREGGGWFISGNCSYRKRGRAISY